MSVNFSHMRALTERECTCGGRGGDHPEACNACLMYHGFNAAEEEIRQLRETNGSLNRRATKAEGIVLSKARDESKAGRSLGRALANAAWTALRAENEALIDSLKRCRPLTEDMEALIANAEGRDAR